MEAVDVWNSDVHATRQPSLASLRELDVMGSTDIYITNTIGAVESAVCETAFELKPAGTHCRSDMVSHEANEQETFTLEPTAAYIRSQSETAPRRSVEVEFAIHYSNDGTASHVVQVGKECDSTPDASAHVFPFLQSTPVPRQSASLVSVRTPVSSPTAASHSTKSTTGDGTPSGTGTGTEQETTRGASHDTQGSRDPSQGREDPEYDYGNRDLVGYILASPGGPDYEDNDETMVDDDADAMYTLGKMSNARDDPTYALGGSLQCDKDPTYALGGSRQCDKDPAYALSTRGRNDPTYSLGNMNNTTDFSYAVGDARGGATQSKLAGPTNPVYMLGRTLECHDPTYALGGNHTSSTDPEYDFGGTTTSSNTDPTYVQASRTGKEPTYILAATAAAHGHTYVVGTNMHSEVTD